jgi:hypothetical protein
MRKYCSRCKKKRDIKNFYKNKSTKDGLTHHCKDCQRVYSRQYYYENIDLYHAYHKNKGKISITELREQKT